MKQYKPTPHPHEDTDKAKNGMMDGDGHVIERIIKAVYDITECYQEDNHKYVFMIKSAYHGDETLPNIYKKGYHAVYVFYDIDTGQTKMRFAPNDWAIYTNSTPTFN